MILTPLQIFVTMRTAGFPPTVAVTMTAIALRESAGNPDAFNGNEATGDRSYGLTQINMRDRNVANLIYTKLIGMPPSIDEATVNGHEKELLDPLTNAKAAHLLWGGRNANLDVAWYIDHPGVYQDRYVSHLAAAQQAALMSPLGISDPKPPAGPVT